MPIFNLDLPFYLLKSKLIKIKTENFFWDHFLTNFDDNNNCTLHYISVPLFKMPPVTSIHFQFEPPVESVYVCIYVCMHVYMYVAMSK